LQQRALVHSPHWQKQLFLLSVKILYEPHALPQEQLRGFVPAGHGIVFPLVKSEVHFNSLGADLTELIDDVKVLVASDKAFSLFVILSLNPDFT
jgi:hypothetical protein